MNFVDNDIFYLWEQHVVKWNGQTFTNSTIMHNFTQHLPSLEYLKLYIYLLLCSDYL